MALRPEIRDAFATMERQWTELAERDDRRAIGSGQHCTDGMGLMGAVSVKRPAALFDLDVRVIGTGRI